jgi:phage terminase large subunit-like protein
MQNRPVGRDGDYWNAEDYQYGTPEAITKVFCWVDPPVTVKKRSDPAGVAIVGFSPPRPLLPNGQPVPLEIMAAVGHKTTKWSPGKVVVFQALEIRKTGKPLGEQVIKVIQAFQARAGYRVGGVLVESNQGGDLWYEVLEEMLAAVGLPMLTHAATESKEVRFARALDYYQRGQVWHAQQIPPLEQQQQAFPKAAHDDVVDAACAGVLHFLDRKPLPKRRSGTEYPS